MQLSDLWFRSYTDWDSVSADWFSQDFAYYAAASEAYLRRVRQQAGRDVSDDVIEMNMPYYWRPSGKVRTGILMVHGYLASPYMARGFARLLVDQGYAVMSLLLPGHGAVPGDLLRAKRRHWQSAVQFGLDQLSTDVDQVVIQGFSMGSLLGLMAAPHHTSVAGVVAHVPALGIDPVARVLPWVSGLLRCLPDVSKFSWVSREREENQSGFASMPFVGAAEVQRLVDAFWRSDVSVYDQMPIFLTAVEADAVVRIAPIVQFCRRGMGHSQSCLYYYGDPDVLSRCGVTDCQLQVTTVDDADLQDNVLSLSHVAPIVSPGDPYLGRDSALYGYQDDVVYGEVSAPNLARSDFRRLRFNPDYPNLSDAVARFLMSL